MSEIKNRIRETLNELHAELETAEEVDPEIRDLLLGAAKEIDERLLPTDEASTAESSEGESTEPPLNARLAEAARHFEESHPTLSGIISTLANGLSQLGI